MDGWLHTTAEAYAQRVMFKPGALAYLRALKRAGVKLAVATANREALFEPPLRRFGAMELFDAVCTSAEVGDAAKDDGVLFRLAARRLNVDPEDCVVFEDAVPGVMAGKAAGMKVVCVTFTRPREVLLDAGADMVVNSYREFAGKELP